MRVINSEDGEPPKRLCLISSILRRFCYYSNMTNIRIVQRPLKRDEAEAFSREMMLTPNITGYRYEELMRLDHVLVMEAAGTAVGLLAFAEADQFIDLKILLVKASERGKGYGTHLMEFALKRFSKINKPVYSVTRNPIVIKMLTEAGFTKVSFFQLPLACQLHQSKMAFSLYRIIETLRKSKAFPHQPAFSYYIKLS